ncbi:MAG: hypothetical protein AAGJ08_22755 [Cyanobacteria bacterium P01_H01_bin.35]
MQDNIDVKIEIKPTGRAIGLDVGITYFCQHSVIRQPLASCGGAGSFRGGSLTLTAISKPNKNLKKALNEYNL